MKIVRLIMLAASAAGLAACATISGHAYGGAEGGVSGFADSGARGR